MKFSFQKLFAGLIIIIVLAVVLFRGDELVDVAQTIQQGTILPLVAAVGTQLCKYFAQSFAYSNAFAAIEEKMRARDTLPLVFGTFFMNTVAPSLNTAGMALVVDDARQRGIAPGKATSAAILMQMSIESGFMVIMLIAFGVLEVTGNLDPLWFLLGLIVMVMVGIMLAVLVLGHKKPKQLMKLLRPIERFVNKVLTRFKRKPLKPWADKIVVSFGEAAGLMAKNPKKTAKVFGFSVLASTCELACFCLVGISFGVTVPQALICGYVVATLFAMISITPQGVGVVEGAVTVLFTSYGVSGASGMAIALVYRSLVFWMPFLIGAVLIQRTKSFNRKKKGKTEGQEDDSSVGGKSDDAAASQKEALDPNAKGLPIHHIVVEEVPLKKRQEKSSQDASVD